MYTGHTRAKMKPRRKKREMVQNFSPFSEFSCLIAVLHCLISVCESLGLKEIDKVLVSSDFAN